MSRVPISECFTGLSETYHRHRPSYPARAIEFITRGLPGKSVAADVGCGTGISTRLLAARVHKVIGMDPNADMLEQARSSSALGGVRIEFHEGTGERTGLKASSLDLVLCAQSFHWFDSTAALREFHRILKPGGRLALMWNIRDDRDEFTAGYGEVVRRAQADAAARGLTVRNDHAADVTQGGFFELMDKQRFVNPQAFDLEGFLGRARSASYFPRVGELRDELEAVLQTLFERHSQKNQVVMQQFAEVTLGRRLDTSG